jgi:hypothetical protein|nr:MAG TPA_asm: hypothetical protein [Caudoviricetes sp.]
MLNIDPNYILALITFVALISPSIANYINCKYNTKIRKFEILEDRNYQLSIFKRDIYLNYLECASYIIVSKTMNIQSEQQYKTYFLKALSISDNQITEYLIRINDLITDKKYKDAFVLLQELSPLIHNLIEFDISLHEQKTDK